MTGSCTFLVLGHAQTKGSTKSFAFVRKDGSLGTRTTSMTQGLPAWERAIQGEAQRHVESGAWHFRGPGRPIGIDAAFSLPRPKRLPRARAVWHTTRPDLDKLVRAVKDALRHVCYADDGQVVELRATKCYAQDGEAPHVRLTLWLP